MPVFNGNRYLCGILLVQFIVLLRFFLAPVSFSLDNSSMKKLFLLFLLLYLPTSYAGTIDIVFVFTSSGEKESISQSKIRLKKQNLTLKELTLDLIQVLNKRFKNNSLPEGNFSFAGTHQLKKNIDMKKDSTQFHINLIQSSIPLATEVQNLKAKYKAAILVLVFGKDDNPSQKIGGMSNKGSRILMVNGSFLGVDAILEHELGHEFGVSQHNFNTPSIMSLPDKRNSEFFTPYERSIIKKALPNYLESSLRIEGAKLFSCDLEGQLKSTYSENTTSNSYAFYNKITSPVTVYWLNYSGIRQVAASIQPGKSSGHNSNSTSYFLIEVDKKCLGIVQHTSTGWGTYNIIEN